MSDSTPRPNGTKPGVSSGTSTVTPGKSSVRWWIASFVFHGLVLAWLVFLSPVRLFDPKAKPVGTLVSGSQARKVVEQIREKQAVSMEQNLRTLEDIRKKIALLENKQRDEFTNIAQELGRDMPVKAAADEQNIARIQAEALAALDQSVSNGDRYVKTRANAYFDDLRDAERLAGEKQSRVLQLQDQAQGLLSLGDARFASAQAAMKEAGAAQSRAAKALAEAQTASDAARGSRNRTALEGQIEHYSYHVRRNREIVVNSETNFVIAHRRVTIAESILARRQSIVDEMVKKSAPDNSDTARTQLQAANKMLDSAQRDLAWARRLEGEAPKELADAQENLPELVAKVAQLLSTTDPEHPQLTAEDRKLVEQHNAARQLQLEAQQAQAKAAQAIAAIKELKNEGAAGSEALAALDQSAPAEPPPPPAEAKSSNLSQMYASAKKTESSLTQSYRRLRAMNLALVRRMPLAKAVDLIDVTKPVRPDLDAALQTSVNSGQDATAAREAVQTAKAEVGAMVQLADSLLAQAQNMDANLGTTISLENYNQRFDELQAMENMAGEDAGGDVMDLTSAGGPAGEGNPGSGGQGGASSGRGGATGSGGAGNAGTGNGGEGGGLPNMGQTGIAGPFGKPGNQNGSSGDGKGNGPGSGPGGPGGFGLRGIRGAPGDLGRAENVTERVKPAPGRRVAARGSSARWFYVDSWYVLGPFDNTGRRNIDRKFPPEEVIDLNAKYPGKNGVQIHWEFEQSGTPNLMPHLEAYTAASRKPGLSDAENRMNSLQYIIYYAYTELWFEKECDLWVAVGSDDFSKVWIEDKLVWSSGKNLKAWQLNEGLRKVHFKQGTNRVLCRVENGNNITEFSLVVSLLP